MASNLTLIFKKLFMTVYWQIGQLVQRKTVIEENWKKIDPVLDGEYFDVEIFTLQKTE